MSNVFYFSSRRRISFYYTVIYYNVYDLKSDFNLILLEYKNLLHNWFALDKSIYIKERDCCNILINMHINKFKTNEKSDRSLSVFNIVFY